MQHTHRPSFPGPCPLPFFLSLSRPMAGPSQLGRKSPFAHTLLIIPPPPFDRCRPIPSPFIPMTPAIVAVVRLELVIRRSRPFPLGDDEDVVEEEQVVALVAESPPDAQLFGGDGQLSALLQPPGGAHQRERLQRHSRGFARSVRPPCLRPALTLILPNSICFWMVYICSVLSIRLAPSLQLLTNCRHNRPRGNVTVPLRRGRVGLGRSYLAHGVQRPHGSEVLG